MMWKSDSCLYLPERRGEALSLAMACVKVIKSTNTILLTFNTALHLCPPEQAIEIFLTLLADYSQEPSVHKKRTHVTETIPADSVDYLSRIILGCQVLKESTALSLNSVCSETCEGTHRDFIRSSLLVAWIQGYMSHRTELLSDRDEIAYVQLSDNCSEVATAVGSNISLCEVLLELISHFLEINLSVDQGLPILLVDQNQPMEVTDADGKSVASLNTDQNTKSDMASSPFDCDSSHYHLLCPSNLVKSHIFVHLQQLVAILEQSKEISDYHPPIYRVLESLYTLAQLSWNLGVLLSNGTNDDDQEKLILAIELLELSERLFSFLSAKEDKSLYKASQFKCLLSSTSLRLDVSTNLAPIFLQNESVPILLESEGAGYQESRKLSQLSENIEKLSNLIDNIEDDPLLHKLYLILSVAVFCRTNNPEVESFVEANQGYFLTFQPHDLEKCADIAQNERYGNLGICRKMLQFGIQVSSRDTTPNYLLLGSLYKRLIQISPNRPQASS
jgi:hypothetical protein